MRGKLVLLYASVPGLQIPRKSISHSGVDPLFFGPVFRREVVLAPRRPKLFLARSVYVTVLLILMCTAWLVVAGTQIIRNVGDMARFGAVLFQILAPLQLAVAVFGSAMVAASAVSLDRKSTPLNSSH